MTEILSSDIQIGRTDYRKSRRDLNVLRYDFAPKGKKNKIIAKMEKALALSRVLNDPSNQVLIDEKKLPKLARRILYTLEARATLNNGDCRWDDSKIAELFGVSIRTVQRALLLLEEHMLIQRFTDRKYDPKRAKKNGNGFYCIRTFRCVRLHLFYLLKPQTAKEMRWKSDSRPYMHPSWYKAFGVDDGWFVGHPTEVIDITAKRLRDRIKIIRPKAPSRLAMAKRGLWSEASERIAGVFRSEARDGYPRAQKIMGWRF